LGDSHHPKFPFLEPYLPLKYEAAYVFPMNLTSLTWKNISSHIGKLEEHNYIEIEIKSLKKLHSMVKLTELGRKSFQDYKSQIQTTLNSLPE
jgi:hypothetical protein